MVHLFSLCDALKHLEVTSRPLNIDELPYDALQHIFTHIPLVDLLISVPAVSLSWAEHTADALRARRSLVLQIGHQEGVIFPCACPNCVCGDTRHLWPDRSNVEVNKLVPYDGQLNKLAVATLLYRLPRIGTLFVYLHSIPDEQTAWMLILLLTYWAPHLRHLIIKCNVHSSPVYHPQTVAPLWRLLHALNQLPNLVWFSFYFAGCLLPPVIKVDRDEDAPAFGLDLPVLRQLKHFSMYTLDSSYLLMGASYTHYLSEAPAHLSQLRLNCPSSIAFKGRYSLLEYSPTVASKFINLDALNWEEANLPAFALLADRFCNLHTLSLPLTSQLPLASLVGPLGRGLSQLVILILTFHYSSGITGEIEAIERLVDLEAVSSPSVLVLRLYNISITSHRDLECLQLHRLFPSLNELSFYPYHYDCRLCRGPNGPWPLPLATLARCLLSLSERFEHLFEEHLASIQLPMVCLYEPGTSPEAYNGWAIDSRTDPPLIRQRDFHENRDDDE